MSNRLKLRIWNGLIVLIKNEALSAGSSWEERLA